MYLENILKTIFSKSGILILNFALVIITTQLWGAEGRGIISILMADLAIIVIINNIFSNSSVSYFTSRVNLANLIKPSLIWILSVSFLGTLIFMQIHKNINPFALFFLTILTSFTTFNLAIFIGREELSQYNLFSLLLPLLTLIFIIVITFIASNPNPDIYFYSYGASYLIISILSWKKLHIKTTFNQTIHFPFLKNLFNYGFKNEFGYFLQFLNYRFSYFIILHYWGIKQVGLFSIGIAIAEAVWVISKSLSLVQYSKIINTKKQAEVIETTHKLAKLSILATLFIGIIILFIPNQWLGFVFGDEFTMVKPFILMLFPGIIFLSFSNVYAHHLAGLGIMKPLILKSAYGLVITLIFSYWLIPKYGITGACITTSASHLISSFYTIIAFKKHIRL